MFPLLSEREKERMRRELGLLRPDIDRDLLSGRGFPINGSYYTEEDEKLYREKLLRIKKYFGEEIDSVDTPEQCPIRRKRR